MLRILNFRKPAPPQHTVDPSNFALTTVFKSSWNNYIFQRVFENNSLRKQPTFGDATTVFPAKWRLRNECRNSILMTRHYPDLGSASDWLNQISHEARPNVGCFLRLCEHLTPNLGPSVSRNWPKRLTSLAASTWCVSRFSGPPIMLH